MLVYLLAVLALFAFMYTLWSTVAQFRWTFRAKANSTDSVIGTLVTFTLIAFAYITYQNQAAREAGFLDASDRRLAEQVGYSDPTEWSAQRANYITVEEAERRRSQAARRERILAQEQAANECRNSISCWGEKSWSTAEAFCSPWVERMALHDYEWTDGFLEPKFNRYRWMSRSSGIITYIGDKIKMQNGFGAWTFMTYECDFNTVSREIIDVRVSEGRP